VHPKVWGGGSSSGRGTEFDQQLQQLALEEGAPVGHREEMLECQRRNFEIPAAPTRPGYVESPHADPRQRSVTHSPPQ